MPEDRTISLSKLLISTRILFIAQPSRAARTCYDSSSLFASAAPAKESSYSFSTSPTSTSVNAANSLVRERFER